MGEIPQDDAEFKRIRKLGLLVLAGFGVLSFLFICGGGAWVGYSGYHSESAGVRAMTFASGPMGFAGLGLLGAVAGHFLIKKSAALKVALPVGLGFFGGIGGLGLTVLFFEVIFPAL